MRGEGQRTGTERRAHGRGRRASGAWSGLLAAVLLAAAVPVTRVQAGPALLGSVGRTGAITGNVNEGGMALGASALWPLEDKRFFAGAMLIADDLGTELVELVDPNDGTPLGTSSGLHRAVYGAAFRLDAELAKSGWSPLASGTWGAYVLRDDVRGEVQAYTPSTGFTLAGGVRYGFRSRLAIAGVVRYARLFNDSAGRYLSYGAEFRLR